MAALHKPKDFHAIEHFRAERSALRVKKMRPANILEHVSASVKRRHAQARRQRGVVVFTGGRYPRGHARVLDEGVDVPTSAAPTCMPQPLSRLYAVDFTRRAGFRVESYEDVAHGVSSPTEKGRLFMSHITLRPVMVFCGGNIPSGDDLTCLHHLAHDACYIAHSLRAEITLLPHPQMRVA